MGHKLLSAKALSEKGIISERGIMGASVPVYLAVVGNEQIEKPTDMNVKEVVKIVPKHLKKGFMDGFIEINGRKCLCQDGYTAFAIFMMGLHNEES